MGKEVQVCRHECVGVCGEVKIVCVVCTSCVVGLLMNEYWLLCADVHMAGWAATPSVMRAVQRSRGRCDMCHC
jgi:hypothetical protein